MQLYSDLFSTVKLSMKTFRELLKLIELSQSVLYAPIRVISLSSRRRANSYTPHLKRKRIHAKRGNTKMKHFLKI